MNNFTNNINTTTSKLISFFWTLVSLFALFLAFRCNRGFNIWGILGAIFFGPIYVVYKLGTNWNKCMNFKS